MPTMNIYVSDSGLKWFKDEVGLGTGDSVKFYAMIYGSSPVQEGFALGFAIEDPIDAVVRKEAEGILFFVEETDLWFFNGHDLHVDYNVEKDEIEYTYTKQ
jgi:uncharacterized protein YneR